MGIVLGVLVSLALVTPMSAAKQDKSYTLACANPGNTVVSYPTPAAQDKLLIVWHGGHNTAFVQYYYLDPNLSTSPVSVATPTAATKAELWLKTDDTALVYDIFLRQVRCH
jgi:hypothetical protein